MAKQVKDPDLKAALTQARKNPRNFVLVAKGTSAVKLIVQKKPITAGDVQKAKTEFKGNLVVEGICLGDGPEMVFNVTGEEPNIKVLTIKDLIGEETELTMKSRFQVVNDLPKVPENDAPEAPEQQATETNENPPPAPPPPPQAPPLPNSDPVAQAIAQLTAAMNKLNPVIQSAAKSHPDRSNELQTAVETFNRQIQGKEVENAKTTLLAVGKLAKELAAAAAAKAQADALPNAPPVDTTAQVDPKAAQWEKAWAELEPEYLDALKKASSDLASKMRVIHAYAFEQAEATQYDKALTAIGRLKPLLALAAQGTGASGEVEKGTFEKRTYMIERIQKLPVEIRPEVDKLKAAIATKVQNEDPEELASKIEEGLQAFFDDIQKEIDAAINKGNMKALEGMSNRVLADPLVNHLVGNPMTQGVAFATIIRNALTDIEEKLKA